MNTGTTQGTIDYDAPEMVTYQVGEIVENMQIETGGNLPTQATAGNIRISSSLINERGADTQNPSNVNYIIPLQIQSINQNNITLVNQIRNAEQDQNIADTHFGAMTELDPATARQFDFDGRDVGLNSMNQNSTGAGIFEDDVSSEDDDGVEESNDDMMMNSEPSEKAIKKEDYMKSVAAFSEKNVLGYYYIKNVDDPHAVKLSPYKRFLYLHVYKIQQDNLDVLTGQSYISLGEGGQPFQLFPGGLKGTKRNTSIQPKRIKYKITEALGLDYGSKKAIKAVVFGRANKAEKSIPNDIILEHPQSKTSRVHAAIMRFGNVVEQYGYSSNPESAMEEEKEVIPPTQNQPSMLLVDLCGDKAGTKIKPKEALFELKLNMEIKDLIDGNVFQVKKMSASSITLAPNAENVGATDKTFDVKDSQKGNFWAIWTIPKMNDVEILPTPWQITLRQAFLPARGEKRLIAHLVNYQDKWYILNNLSIPNKFSGFWVKTMNNDETDIENLYSFYMDDYLLMVNYLVVISRQKNLELAGSIYSN
jgi:hypothetical protein